MIPMVCPNCGRRGSVPPDKLNARLHCKKCDTIFHMDVSGHIVLGEPGRASGAFTVPGRDSGSHGKVGSGVHTRTTTTAQRTELPGIWASLPKTAKGVLVGALAITLLWALGVRLPFGSRTPLPATLEQRIGYVVEAFAYNEPSSLRRIAASGTSGDLSDWLAKLYPEADLGARRQVGYLVTHTFRVVSGGQATDGQTRAMVIIAPPIPTFFGPDVKDAQAAQADRLRQLTDTFTPGPLPDGSFALPLVWKSEDGQWWLDGTASLQAAANPAVAADTDRSLKKAS